VEEVAVEQDIQTPLVVKVVLVVKTDNQMLVVMVVEIRPVVLKVVEMVVDWEQTDNLKV
jgi:hypothetical protein